MGMSNTKAVSKDKRRRGGIRHFPCPRCGNELPCSNNDKIRCCWCNALIQPKGYKNNTQEACIIKG